MIKNKSNEINIYDNEIQTKTMRYSIIVFLCVSILLIGIDRINNIFSPELSIAFFSFLITSRVMFYKYTRKKTHLIWMGVFIITLMIAIMDYVDILL